MTITAYIPKGVIRITDAVDIGSVTLVGSRNLIKAPALPALKYDTDHLHGPNPLDEGFATSSALIGSRSSLIRISPDRDLPPEIRSDFAQFIGEIISVKTEGDEGNIRATVDSLDEMGVHRAVEKIIGFYDTVSRHQEPY